MQIDERLSNILLYAIGMITNEQKEAEVVDRSEGQVRSIDFFRRIAKYLRSIGYYGDSPFMMANYGSSEYA